VCFFLSLSKVRGERIGRKQRCYFFLKHPPYLKGWVFQKEKRRPLKVFKKKEGQEMEKKKRKNDQKEINWKEGQVYFTAFYFTV